MRKRIANELGVKLYDIYGLTEVYGPGIAISCEHECGMHYWDDYVYIEIVDPKTGKNLPDGEIGEIVITTLHKEGPHLSDIVHMIFQELFRENAHVVLNIQESMLF